METLVITLNATPDGQITGELQTGNIKSELTPDVCADLVDVVAPYIGSEAAPTQAPVEEDFEIPVEEEVPAEDEV